MTAVLTFGLVVWVSYEANRAPYIDAGSFQPVVEVRSIPEPDFTNYAAVDRKKDAFFKFFTPLVQTSNRNTLRDRDKLIALMDGVRADTIALADRDWLIRLGEQYGVPVDGVPLVEIAEKLLTRLHEVPLSLALAQAAKESGWGTSRFAVEANNYFGQQCFIEGCGMVPAHRRRGSSHEIAVFSSAQQSVDAYVLNLNRHRRYARFRALRAAAVAAGERLKGTQLSAGLLGYSVRGDAYVRELNALIKYNGLE